MTHTLAHYLELAYPISLLPEAEGGYTAMHPDLPGCLTVGETAEEALENLKDAKQLWLEDAFESGHPIPLPVHAREYSGRVLLRMPPALHQALTAQAERAGNSLNQYIIGRLSR
jgi:antitoxin HicB